jgi:anti-sigma regulatory factor (Ser/Thr protein kinase)
MTTMSSIDVYTLVDRELPPVLESVPYARDLVVHSVPAELRRDVALVVSELVANAVKHGSGPVGLRVDVQGDSVRIAVRDCGPTPSADRGDGLGLHIIEQLAAATGIDHHDAGKTIWAELVASPPTA